MLGISAVERCRIVIMAGYTIFVTTVHYDQGTVYVEPPGNLDQVRR